MGGEECNHNNYHKAFRCFEVNKRSALRRMVHIKRRFKLTQRNTAQLFKDRMDTVVHHSVLSFAFPKSPQRCPFCLDS